MDLDGNVSGAIQWDMSQLRVLWDHLSTQIHPFAQVLCLDGNLYRLLDQEAKRSIAQRFM